MVHVGPQTKTLLSKSFALCHSKKRIMQNSFTLKKKKKDHRQMMKPRNNHAVHIKYFQTKQGSDRCSFRTFHFTCNSVV